MIYLTNHRDNPRIATIPFPAKEIGGYGEGEYAYDFMQLLFPEGEGLVGIWSIHCDESTDSKKKFVYTIAGYIGWHGDALDLAFKWERLLEKEGLEYFKASECEGGFGPFRKYRDNPTRLDLPLQPHEKDRLREVKTQFVSLANSNDLLGIAIGVVVEDFYKVLRENPGNRDLGPHPYFLAYRVLLMSAGLLMGYLNKKWKTGHVLAPIFDEMEEVSGRAKEMYDDFRRINPQVSKWLVGMSYESENRFKSLQAADNLAYEANKWLYNQRYDSARPERKAMTRILERTYEVALYEEKVLKEVVARGLTEQTMYDAVTLRDYDIHRLPLKGKRQK